MSEEQKPSGGSAAAIIASLVFVLVFGVGTIFATKWLSGRIEASSQKLVAAQEAVPPPPVPCVVLMTHEGPVRVKSYAYVDEKTGILYLFKSEAMLIEFMLKGYITGAGGMALPPGQWISYFMFPSTYCDQQPPVQPSRYSDQRGKPSTL